jgi:CRISPR system Cascade subunit CasD
MNDHPATGTLLLRLAGPMQSWDTRSKHTERDTDMEPSKSGVIGLLCAALGHSRTDPIGGLAKLKMGVRVDKPGSKQPDLQTAMDVLQVQDGTRSVISTRYYLADAAFLVGLQGEMELLRLLHAALRDPVWPLSLGRKAFVPGDPIWMEDGLIPGEDFETALQTYPWHPRPCQEKLKLLKLILEDIHGDEVRFDHPISFKSNDRRFVPRRMRVEWISPPFNPDPKEKPLN